MNIFNLKMTRSSGLDSTGKVVVPFTYQAENVKDYLDAEFMVNFENQRDAFTIKAMKTPELAVADRNTARSAVTAKGGSVATYFDKRFTDLVKMGLPQEKARAIALKAAEYLYNDEIAMLNTQYPGLFDKSMASASSDFQNMVNKNNIAGTGVHGETVSDYKLRKAAKRALQG